MKRLLLISLASIALLTGASAFARCGWSCNRPCRTERACPKPCPKPCRTKCAPLTQCEPCCPITDCKKVPVQVYREICTTTEAGPCFCECPLTDAIFQKEPVNGDVQVQGVRARRFGRAGRRVRAPYNNKVNNGYAVEETTAVVE